MFSRSQAVDSQVFCDLMNSASSEVDIAEKSGEENERCYITFGDRDSSNFVYRE